MEEKLSMTTVLTGLSLDAHKAISKRLGYGEGMAAIVRMLLIDCNAAMEKEDEKQAKLKKGAK